MRKPRPQTLVWLASSALASIATEHSRYSAVETGGLLVGYWANGAEVVITDATGGGPLARHGPKAYVPDAAHDAAETARLYAASGRLHTYLGDWHSHPAASVRLSRRDRQTLGDIARHENARAPRPLMAVVAGTDEALAVAVWVLRARRARHIADVCHVQVFAA